MQTLKIKYETSSLKDLNLIKGYKNKKYKEKYNSTKCFGF